MRWIGLAPSWETLSRNSATRFSETIHHFGFAERAGTMACLPSIFCYCSPFVHPVVKKFMVVLAVLTVGAVQLFGGRIGYLCACTGDFSQEATCQPTECHSNDSHQEARQSAPTCQESGQSCGGQNQHNEVRDTLPMTSGLALLSLPAPVFFELLEVFQTCKNEVIEADEPGRLTWLCPDSDRSPPAAILVTGTVVLMI
jgi:hypothetical protein